MFGRYLLRNQVGAGRDGVRYRAFDPRAMATVDLRVLHAWDDHQAKRLRTAALLTHPTALHILALELEQTPPFVVLEWSELPRLSESSPPEASRLPLEDALAGAAALASGLAEAHRLGLVHGRLGPSTLHGQGARNLKIDWTGLEVEPTGANAEPDRTSRALEPSADVDALGALLAGWLSGLGPDCTPGAIPEHVAPLIRAMRAADPLDRPTAAQVAERLGAMLATRGASDVGVTTVQSGNFASESVHNTDTLAGFRSEASRLPDRLGRFVLREKLGEGGMGTVFRGEDLTDGSTVAIKVLRDSWSQRPDALRRFAKEARLLAELNNPYVTNLVEVNEDGGIHYLALEFVRGKSLSRVLSERRRLDEPTALAVMADVARALADAHERGIVHRDVKPENILLVGDESESEAALESDLAATIADNPADTVDLHPTIVSGPRVKLSDFGLARHVFETESLNLTQPGAILGTPLYMAPEQCTGADGIGPPADVYAMGATLFHLVTGRPPFEGGSPVSLIARHRGEPPPKLRDLNDNVSEGLAQVVAKALAKAPEERYADAGAMLLDLERLLRGEPTGINVHPVLPDCDPGELVTFDFRWDLDASPAQLWPHVSNTERLNRALGLPAIPFTTEYDPVEGVQRFGRLRTAGIAVAWREHPYEWVEGRRMGVLRVFDTGPFRWFVSIVELEPRAGGGTTLTHRVRVAVNGLVGRAVAALKIGGGGRRAMDRVYRRIDAALTGKLGHDAVIVPFEPPAPLSDARTRKLDAWLESLGRQGIDPTVAERLGEFLAQAPAQEVARIRPLALARRLGLDPDQVVAACLHGAHNGALLLLWDLLCPVCRIPSQVLDTLRALRDHAHCEACHLDFTLDFANSVELIFRAHPEIRDSELGTYCIGGPAHSPHVIAQIRVRAGERFALDLTLGEGSYRLRGPQLPYAIDFRVEPSATSRQWELNLATGPAPDLPRVLRAGSQTLALTNATAHELVVRIERTAPRVDALTAARASALPLFRELFPSEVLSAGQLISLATITLLVTELDQAGDLYQRLGDARAFALIHEHFHLLDECLRTHEGALVKTVGEGVVAVFTEPAAAVRAALALGPALSHGELTRDLVLRVGVHRGPALVATLNDHLDYFGTTVKTAALLPRLAEGGGVILSPAVAADPLVAALLASRGLALAVVEAADCGLAEGFAHRAVGQQIEARP